MILLMRITGGDRGGRRLQVPAGDRVRPTQDRVREALFSMLAAAMPGARFLDLFAGSGAVGLDAASRGAAEVTWVESDRRVFEVLQANLRALSVTGGTAVCADVAGWLRGPGRGRNFDMVFADPPYEWAQAHGFAEIMRGLHEGGVLRPGGVFIAERAARREVEEPQGWVLLRDRVYGKTQVLMYRLDETTGESTC
jgi:16S rRNA (guanine966-N2)-methyltransferase